VSVEALAPLPAEGLLGALGQSRCAWSATGWPPQAQARAGGLLLGAVAEGLPGAAGAPSEVLAPVQARVGGLLQGEAAEGLPGAAGLLSEALAEALAQAWALVVPGVKLAGVWSQPQFAVVELEWVAAAL
jgi:hypothetical protein